MTFNFSICPYQDTKAH